MTAVTKWHPSNEISLGGSTVSHSLKHLKSLGEYWNFVLNDNAHSQVLYKNFWRNYFNASLNTEKPYA